MAPSPDAGGIAVELLLALRDVVVPAITPNYTKGKEEEKRVPCRYQRFFLPFDHALMCLGSCFVEADRVAEWEDDGSVGVGGHFFDDLFALKALGVS